jgi:hypothetical protein
MVGILRSVIGSERFVLRSDLPSPECSYRTHALRTRIRCARRVDVIPAEPEELGLAKPTRRRSEDDKPQHRSERVPVDGVVRDHCDHGVAFRQRQELQVRIRVAVPPAPRSRSAGHRVADRPAALHGECNTGAELS